MAIVLADDATAAMDIEVANAGSSSNRAWESALPDIPTVCAVGLAAGLWTVMIHEVVGHALVGGVFVGQPVEFFNSVFVVTTPPPESEASKARWIKAAGSFVNALLAILLWVVYIRKERAGAFKSSEGGRSAAAYGLFFFAIYNLGLSSGYPLVGLFGVADWSHVWGTVNVALANGTIVPSPALEGGGTVQGFLVAVSAAAFMYFFYLVIYHMEAFVASKQKGSARIKQFAALCWIPYFGVAVLKMVAAAISPCSGYEVKTFLYVMSLVGALGYVIPLLYMPLMAMCCLTGSEVRSSMEKMGGGVYAPYEATKRWVGCYDPVPDGPVVPRSWPWIGIGAVTVVVWCCLAIGFGQVDCTMKV